MIDVYSLINNLNPKQSQICAWVLPQVFLVKIMCFGTGNVFERKPGCREVHLSYFKLLFLPCPLFSHILSRIYHALLCLFNLIQIDYPEIADGVAPRHRFMSAYEQRVEPPDKKWQYLLFAAEPYETISFKVSVSSTIEPSKALCNEFIVSCCQPGRTWRPGQLIQLIQNGQTGL